MSDHSSLFVSWAHAVSPSSFCAICHLCLQCQYAYFADPVSISTRCHRLWHAHTIISSLGCSVLRTGNPINTRTELGCLGLLGTFWLGTSLRLSCASRILRSIIALGAYLASSTSENADVECFSSADETTLLDVAGCALLACFSISFRRAHSG